MNSSLVLALDIGTSSIRAALCDVQAVEMPETAVRVRRDSTNPPDGGFEFDAEELFLQIVSVVDNLVARSGNSLDQVEYAATSAFWHSILGIDRDDNPVTNAYGWAETRPQAVVGDLRREFDEGQIHHRTGCRFHSTYWPAKILWLQRTDPDSVRRTAKWISFTDYLSIKLFGKLKTSVSMASGTGIFDIRQCIWDKPLLDYLRVSEDQLPPVAESDGETVALKREYAARWPGLQRTKWFPAIGDGAANNIGANCFKQDRACLMVGTSGAMRVAFQGGVPEEIPPGLWCYRIDRKRIVIGGALSDGGGLYQWLKDNLRLGHDDEEITRAIASRLPDSHGLTFLPFLAGERSTGYHGKARGAIVGLTKMTDGTDIARSALEAVAYRFAAIYSQLKMVGDIREIHASGGALRDSSVWTQIICDVLGSALELPDVREASLRGAALLALEASGQIDEIASDRRAEGKRLDFDPEKHAVYENARKRHEELYSALINGS